MTISKPFNSIAGIKKLVKQGKVRINGNALQGAMDCFNWGKDEIIECLLKLKKEQCYKAETHSKFPFSAIDFYRAEKLLDGEDVYLHLYVHEGWVVVNSFKEM